VSYRYFGKSKRPYEFKACAHCGENSWILTTGRYCSRECQGYGVARPKKFTGTITEYKRYHKRVYDRRGRASSCVNGCEATRYEWANLTGRYEDPEDYQAMCVLCHRRMDVGQLSEKGRQGHEGI